ncbi:hypothetical protein PILCRDRAFT_16126 [Piloderma croceum F 1598]|uniref:Uncharacterized protein n=1 Tax=Piloderma croceum (strain F 1598) TaxID=765440 RepID=A0A0C3AF74_PILCF|nr:hypothetical protein PILCRDRAFT_16126 [Piloderma croceum F 1598]
MPGPKYDWKSETLPPILQAIRDHFQPGSEWLWKRCDKVLDPDDPCSIDMELHKQAMRAEDAARDDPVYPSNLSAALYETGDYLGSVQAIFRSWKILSQGSNPTLALKLSTRIAKALIQGVRGGSVTSDVLKDNAMIIDQLEVVAQQRSASTSSSIPDHIRVWKDWKKLENQAGDRKEAALQARSRLS